MARGLDSDNHLEMNHNSSRFAFGGAGISKIVLADSYPYSLEYRTIPGTPTKNSPV
jgi:hypothetical protein